MATANSIEDEVTCNVCFSIYEDPYTLTGCLHTYCLKCIKRLETSSEIKCPECRTFTNIEDVKKDCRTKRLIDIHNVEQQEPVKYFSNEDHCGMCQNKTLITHHCAVCQIFLCSKCSQAHKNIKALRSHPLMSYALMKKIDSNLTVSLGQLSDQVKNVDAKLESICKSMTEAEAANAQQVKQIKQFTMHAIEDLKRNQKSLEKLVTDANQTLVNHLQESKILFEEQKKELLSKMALLENLIHNHDMKTLHETAGTLNKTIKDDIKKIEQNLLKKNAHYKSTVEVQKGKHWDVKGSIEVSIDNTEYDNHQIRPGIQILYSELHSKTLKLDHTLDLFFAPYSLCMINNQLWCSGTDDKLYLYDKNCRPVKEINHKEFQNVENVAVTDTGHIVVACNDNGGLHLLNSNGMYLRKIKEGNFGDVAFCDGDIYALESCNNIIVIRKNGNNWHEVNHYTLQNPDDIDYTVRYKLCVQTACVYVSSSDYYCVHVYDTHGGFLYKRGEWGVGRPGMLREPVLCGVDRAGNMLVADCANDRLQLCDSRGQWRIVNLLEGVENPGSAVVSDDGRNMWIASARSCTLQKYTVSIN